MLCNHTLLAIGWLLSVPTRPSLCYSYLFASSILGSLNADVDTANDLKKLQKVCTCLKLIRIRLLQSLADCCQLDVARPLIDGANLAIAPHLLSNSISDEAHSSHPFDRAATNFSRHLASIEFSHGRICDEVFPSLLLPRRVVDESTFCTNFGVCLRKLVLHSLEGAHKLPKLLAIVPHVLCRILPRTQRQSSHLSSDADSAFVKQANGVLVPLAFLA